MRALLASDLGDGKLGQEVARPVEVGHLQIGADALGIVRVRGSAARQPVLRAKRSGAGSSILAPVFNQSRHRDAQSEGTLPGGVPEIRPRPENG